MGLDLTTKTEKLLTWLGMWGAMRGFVPLASAIVVSVALLESLTPPVIRFFSAVPVNLIHVFAVGSAFSLDSSATSRGIRGSPVRVVLWPEGKVARQDRQAVPRVLTRRAAEAASEPGSPGTPKKPDAEDDVYREAVKLAKRQVERWDGIEHPLILSRFMRALLWPLLFATILALVGAAVFPLSAPRRRRPAC